MLSEILTQRVQNHLIETASMTTGSMLIWDTGEYSVLPYREQRHDDSSQDDSDRGPVAPDTAGRQEVSESDKLHRAFRSVGITLLAV